MKPFSPPVPRRLAVLAFGLAATMLAGPAVADPPVALCTPDVAVCAAADVTPCAESTGCLNAAATARACAGGVCTATSGRACRPRDCSALQVALCGPACADVSLGGIEKPAGGTITIHQALNAAPTMALTGVYDPATGFFTCTLAYGNGSPTTVTCTPNSKSYDWYCAGWVVTATANTSTGQAFGKASCLGPSSQSVQTGLAMFGSPQEAHAYGLSWFFDTAVVCEASGYSQGPQPLGDYTVLCNEPGARLP